jgi:hypothetical protein
MARGGIRPGAGRKAGTPNKASAERQKAIEESGLTPLEFLLSVMRGKENAQADRIDAAKAAARYVHPALSAVEMNANVSLSHEEALEQLG